MKNKGELKGVEERKERSEVGEDRYIGKRKQSGGAVLNAMTLFIVVEENVCLCFFFFCFAVFPLVSLLELEFFFRYSKNISKDDKKKKFQERYLTVLV